MARQNRTKLGVERLEDRRVLASSIVEFEDVGYFFDSTSPVVGRYDISRASWLEPITLQNASSGPLVAHVDTNGIYAAFGQSAYRYDITGAGRKHLINLPTPITAIHSDGNLLFLNYSISLYARFVSINKSNNAIIDSVENYINALSGSSIAPTRNTIYGRSIGISPADITYVTYTDDGRFGFDRGDGPYHGDYPTANRTWVFPDESKVIDDSGIIYATSNLTYLNRLNTIEDIDFFQQQLPFVLNGNEVTAYSRAFLPTGRVTLDTSATKIFVNADSVIVFFDDATSEFGYRTQIFPVFDFGPTDPNDPIDPTGLAYKPDWTSVSAQGIVLLLSKSNQSIFRWNPTTRLYEESIPLLGSPRYATFASDTETLYVAYDSGEINKIDLKQTSPREEPFYRLPGVALGLSMAGEFLFAVDDSGAWHTHYVISQSGALQSSRDWNYYSTEYVWNPTNRRMYFFRDDTSPNDLIYEAINSAGQLQPPVDSPYHDSNGWVHPIRISGDGKSVLLGSGFVFDAQTLNRNPYGLANTVTDSLWFAGRWITIRTIASIAQLQEWTGPTLELSKVKQFGAGAAQSIHALTSKRMLVVTIPSDGVPAFTVLDEQLEPATINVRWHNASNPLDVDDDQSISPLDVLSVINEINSRSGGEGESDSSSRGKESSLDQLFAVELDWLPQRERKN